MSVTASVSSADFGRAEAKAPRMRAAAKAAMVDAVLESTAPLVPYRTGALRGSAEAASDRAGGRAVWGGAGIRYARAQYYGCPNKRWPGTVGLWFDVARSRHMAEWARKAGAAAGKVAAS